MVKHFDSVVPVKVYNKGGQPLPSYSKAGDAGMDVRTCEPVDIRPGETIIIKTGLHVKIPFGYEIQVRPRSGLSNKTKMRIANSPGTIDSNYTGEICIIADNIGEDNIKFNMGERIAQLVLAVVPVMVWDEVSSEAELGETNRGSDGFGSSGTL